MEQIISYIQASLPDEKPNNISNQVYIKVFEDETIFIVSVSDWLDSSIYSNEFAKLACECVINILKKEITDIDFKKLSYKILKQWQ